MKLTSFLAVLVVCGSLQGCIMIDGDGNWDDSESWQKSQRHNVRTISQLELNSSRASVIEMMGTPDFTEAYSRADKNYYVLYYRTHKDKSDGVTSKSETTPLVFENDQLIGWGDEALQATIVY